jgi:hypothetical protein
MELKLDSEVAVIDVFFRPFPPISGVLKFAQRETFRSLQLRVISTCWETRTFSLVVLSS